MDPNANDPLNLKNTLDRTQSGLMYFPECGLFVSVGLTDTSGGAKDAVLGMLQSLEKTSRTLTDSGHPSNFVAAFNARIWAQWMGKEPSGKPPSDSILKTSPHLRDSNGQDHLWLFLKSDTAEQCESLKNTVTTELGQLIREVTETLGNQRMDGKVLDHHFNDGVTSPSDPIGVVGPIVMNGDDPLAGSTWVLTQKFVIRWEGYGPQSIDAKEDVIGRGRDGAIIPDDDPHSHIRRARVFDGNQDNLKLLRQALPFGMSDSAQGREKGIYFVSFASSTDVVEEILRNMVGDGNGPAPDKLMNFVEAESGGYWFVPSRNDLGLSSGLRASDFKPAAFWEERSENGYMFYNGNDYINAMSTGKYGPGDPPQGESFLGRKWLIGKKIKKELDKPEGISHAKMV